MHFSTLTTAATVFLAGTTTAFPAVDKPIKQATCMAVAQPNYDAYNFYVVLHNAGKYIDTTQGPDDCGAVFKGKLNIKDDKFRCRAAHGKEGRLDSLVLFFRVSRGDGHDHVEEAFKKATNGELNLQCNSEFRAREDTFGKSA